jgi:hypothetical protein
MSTFDPYHDPYHVSILFFQNMPNCKKPHYKTVSLQIVDDGFMGFHRTLTIRIPLSPPFENCVIQPFMAVFLYPFLALPFN